MAPLYGGFKKDMGAAEAQFKWHGAGRHYRHWRQTRYQCSPPARWAVAVPS